MKYTIILFIGLMAVSCDPHSAFTTCSYQYPINAIGLNDTIKTTDTIWIENDLDGRLCLNEGVYSNGKGSEDPDVFKLQEDTFVNYNFKIVTKDVFDNGVPMRYENGRYKSKYGILIPEPGIYAVLKFGCDIANGKDASVFVQGYFNLSSNNMNLFPASVKMPAWEIGQRNRYFVYFLQVTN